MTRAQRNAHRLIARTATSLSCFLLVSACVSDDIGRVLVISGVQPAVPIDASADARPNVEFPADAGSADGAIADPNMSEAGVPDTGTPVKCNAMMPFQSIRKFPNLSTTGRELGLDIAADGNTMWISVGGRLARSTRINAAGDWSTPSPPIVLTNQGYEDDPSLSADGRALFFAAGPNDKELQIYRAERAVGASDFNVGSVVTALTNNSGVSSDSRPRLRRDGKEICFHSDRTAKNVDIWCAPVKEQVVGSPKAIDELNSNGTDACAVFSSDGLSMYFTSDRMGSQDIWVSTRKDLASTNWAPPTQVMGAGVNKPTSNDQPAWLSADECTLYVISDRDGTYDIWSASRR
jgi:WD40-like Beta Propeller Repeat